MRAVNLIPAEQRAGAGIGVGRSGGAVYVLLGLIACLAAMVLLYGNARHDISARSAEAAKLSAEASQASSEVSALAAYTKFVALQKQREEDVQTLAGSRFDWAHAMRELGRVLPRQVTLSSVTGTVGASSAAAVPAAPTVGATPAAAGGVSSSTPPGSAPTFAIAGCTASQPGVALAMNRLRLMDGVSEVSLSSSAKASSSGDTAASGGCADTFSMQVGFEGLPAPTLGDSTGGAQATAAAKR